MTLGEYIPNSNTKLLLHLNGNSTDSSGNGNNGTVSGATTSNDGKFGGAYSFDGTDDNISFGLTGFPSGSSVFTISIWFNFSKLPRYLYGNDFIIYGKSTSNQAVGIGADQQSTGGAYRLAFWLWASDMFYTFTPSTNTWYNIVYVHEGSGVMKGYLNGNLVMSTTGKTVNVVLDNVHHLAWNTNTTAGTNRRFQGKLDEAIVENRAWTASEVKKYYTYAKGRFGII